MSYSIAYERIARANDRPPALGALSGQLGYMPPWSNQQDYRAGAQRDPAVTIFGPVEGARVNALPRELRDKQLFAGILAVQQGAHVLQGEQLEQLESFDSARLLYETRRKIWERQRSTPSVNDSVARRVELFAYDLNARDSRVIVPDNTAVKSLDPTLLQNGDVLLVAVLLSMALSRPSGADIANGLSAAAGIAAVRQSYMETGFADDEAAVLLGRPSQKADEPADELSLAAQLTARELRSDRIARAAATSALTGARAAARTQLFTAQAQYDGVLGGDSKKAIADAAERERLRAVREAEEAAVALARKKKREAELAEAKRLNEVARSKREAARRLREKQRLEEEAKRAAQREADEAERKLQAERDASEKARREAEERDAAAEERQRKAQRDAEAAKRAEDEAKARKAAAESRAEAARAAAAKEAADAQRAAELKRLADEEARADAEEAARALAEANAAREAAEADAANEALKEAQRRAAADALAAEERAKEAQREAAERAADLAAQEEERRAADREAMLADEAARKAEEDRKKADAAEKAALAEIEAAEKARKLSQEAEDAAAAAAAAKIVELEELSAQQNAELIRLSEEAAARAAVEQSNAIARDALAAKELAELREQRLEVVAAQDELADEALQRAAQISELESAIPVLEQAQIDAANAEMAARASVESEIRLIEPIREAVAKARNDAAQAALGEEEAARIAEEARLRAEAATREYNAYLNELAAQTRAADEAQRKRLEDAVAERAAEQARAEARKRIADAAAEQARELRDRREREAAEAEEKLRAEQAAAEAAAKAAEEARIDTLRKQNRVKRLALRVRNLEATMAKSDVFARLEAAKQALDVANASKARASVRLNSVTRQQAVASHAFTRATDKHEALIARNPEVVRTRVALTNVDSNPKSTTKQKRAAQRNVNRAIVNVTSDEQWIAAKREADAKEVELNALNTELDAALQEAATAAAAVDSATAEADAAQTKSANLLAEIDLIRSEGEALDAEDGGDSDILGQFESSNALFAARFDHASYMLSGDRNGAFAATLLDKLNDARMNAGLAVGTLTDETERIDLATLDDDSATKLNMRDIAGVEEIRTRLAVAYVRLAVAEGALTRLDNLAGPNSSNEMASNVERAMRLLDDDDFSQLSAHPQLLFEKYDSTVGKRIIGAGVASLVAAELAAAKFVNSVRGKNIANKAASTVAEIKALHELARKTREESALSTLGSDVFTVYANAPGFSHGMPLTEYTVRSVLGSVNFDGD